MQFVSPQSPSNLSSCLENHRHIFILWPKVPLSAMKRFSKKLRKRLSTSSKENHTKQAEEHIYNGVTHPQDRDLPKENGLKVPSLPRGRNGTASGNLYSNRPAEALPSLDLDNHDYSTLDGEEDAAADVFTENSNELQQYPAVPPRSPQRRSFGCSVQANGIPTCNQLSSNKLRIRAKSAGTNIGTNSPSPMMGEFQKLARKGWYWGPMAREQAEKKLSNLPEASFLVRDSSDDRYLLSLSFRSNYRTLHTRIEHSAMKFSFYEDSPRQSYTSVIELIENSIHDSTEQGVFCYSRSRQPNAQIFPVRLMHPVSRFTEVRPLQDLCRFVIRQYTRIDHIQRLPLPKQIKGYLNQSYF